MRITVTLYERVVTALERWRRRACVPYRDVVNEALRRGIRQLPKAREPVAQYCTPTSDVGASLIGRVDNTAEVLAIADGEDF